MSSPSRLAIVSAYAGVYFIWGSTYLAIAWVLESFPAFLGAGGRFVLAGGILLAWCKARKLPMPTRSQWRWAAVIGGLLFVGGNGGVVWAEQHLPSGFVALIVASVPAWVVLFEWLQPAGTAPSRLTLAGLVLGFVGVAILVAPQGGGAPRTALLVLAGFVPIAGSACWALGSILSRRGGLPRSALVSTAAQMLCGGALLLVAGSLAREAPRIDLAAVSLKSWLALAYLIVFGSLVAFTCYAWLLQVSEPAKVSTYAYVNPVVAVALGTLAGEPLHPRLFVAGALIVLGVLAITMRARKPQEPATPEGRSPDGRTERAARAPSSGRGG